MRKILNRYTIIRQIGEGGFGRVYLAEDAHLPRQVAIKELRQRFIHDADALRRFANDARVAASLGHANIVTVFDLQPPDTPHYIVMEYVPRGSLAAILEENKLLSANQAIPVAMDICGALEAAHEKGIIHRDLKPENVLLADNGAAKLCDFGVAHVPVELGGLDKTVYPFGHPGDLRCMSPEQVRGEKLDGRSDLYALGGLLYRLVTGHPYLDMTACKSLHDVQKAILHRMPGPPRVLNPGVPVELSNLIMKLLSKDRDQRPAGAREVLGELRRIHGALAAGSVLRVRLVSIAGTVCRVAGRYRFQIKIEADNEGNRSLGLSGLTINVPTIDSDSVYKACDIQMWSIGCKAPFRLGPGQMIWSFLDNGSFGQKPARSLLIECVRDEWKPHDRIALEAVLLVPCSTLEAHVRVWSTRPTDDGGSEGFGDPEWNATKVRDQQGIPAYRISLGFD